MSSPSQKRDPDRGSQPCAGVVTYNPDLDRLAENLSAILEQTDKVFIVDNGSQNIADIESAWGRSDRIEIIRNEDNAGIARALNQLCRAAIGEGYDWILLLDQDSVAPDGMLDELERHRAAGVGIVCPQIIDRRRLGEDTPNPDGETFPLKTAARKGAITSGALVSLSAYSAVGGFDDAMFIDYVDYDFNKRLLLSDYDIIRTGSTHLLHECGHMDPTPLRVPRRDQSGRWRLEHFYTFGHSPARCYYKARNRIIYSRKYWGYPHSLEFAGVFQLPFTILLTLIFEDEREEKTKAFVRGIKDGLHFSLDSSTPAAPPAQGSTRGRGGALRQGRRARSH